MIAAQEHCKELRRTRGNAKADQKHHWLLQSWLSGAAHGVSMCGAGMCRQAVLLWRTYPQSAGINTAQTAQTGWRAGKKGMVLYGYHVAQPAERNAGIYLLTKTPSQHLCKCTTRSLVVMYTVAAAGTMQVWAKRSDSLSTSPALRGALQG